MKACLDERGFTLAELLVAVAVLGLVVSGVTMLQQSAIQAYVAGSNRIESQQAARVGLERMSREIRESTSIVTANGNSITFTMLEVVAPNPAVSITVTYDLNGTDSSLRRTQVAGANPGAAAVIGGVLGLTFVYRDNTRSVLAVPVGVLTAIRTVDITLQTRTEEAATGSNESRSIVSSTVRLRNT